MYFDLLEVDERAHTTTDLEVIYPQAAVPGARWFTHTQQYVIINK